MNDPQRLTDGTGTGLAALLLGAGIEERPSEESLRSTLSVLGLAAAVSIPSAVGTIVGASATTAAAKSGAGLGMGVLFAKWLAVGAVGGGLVLGSTMAVMPSQPRSTHIRLPAAVQVALPERRVNAPRSHPPSIPVAEPSAAPVPKTIDWAPPPVRPVVTEVPLAPEIALVDEARGLLASREFSSVTERLALYETDFPRLQLLPEVLYLRMEAAAGARDAAQTARAASQLSSQFPRSPQATRARELLGRPLDENTDQERLRAGTSK
jgi:hypothetical protein